MALSIGCKLTQNITRTSNCGYNLAEINKIYLANLEEIPESGITIGTGSSESCEGVTAIDSGITWYLIEPAKGSASFTDELVVEDNGNRYRTHTLTFNTIGNYTDCIHMALDDLSLGKYVAIIDTPNGKIMLGRKVGLEATTATLSAGGDTNGMQIVLAGNIAESALPVGPSVDFHKSAN
jgi:hypothetical protein